MVIDIEHIIPLNTDSAEEIQMVQEKDGRVRQYYREGQELKNRSAMIVRGNYTEVEFEDENKLFTTENITNFGVKSRLNNGGYGFWSNTSKEINAIKNPIIRPRIGNTQIVITQTDTELFWEIMLPDSVMFESYRIIFRRGDFAHEIVTYEKNGSDMKPFGLYGEHKVTVLGHRNEIQEVSDIGQPIVFNITLRPDSKSEFDSLVELVKSMENRLLPPGGFIGDSLVKRSNIDYAVIWANIDSERPAPEPFAKGDVNGDGVITVQDAIQIMMFLAKMTASILINDDGTNAVGTPQWNAALIVSDDVPTIDDATEILKYISKQPSVLD